MWINLAPTGFVIASITTGGPAATAGLKAGDIIRSVDGAASGQIRLWDLRKRLRDDPPGTTIRLTVASDQGDRNVTLQLRDLIDP
jgi:S1-C subfamily serine protease